MIRTNVWSPDTCNCKVIYQWDDSLPQDQWVFTAVEQAPDADGKPIQRQACAAHAPTLSAIGKHVAHFNAITDENQRKNVITGKIKELLGEDADWSFDQTRKLVVALKSRKFTLAEKGALKAAVAKVFADAVTLN